MTPKNHIHKAIDEISLVRYNQDNGFNIYDLTKINSIRLKTEAVNDSKVITKAYVDQFHQDNERSRRAISIDFLTNQMIW